jgi:hypothetical protein
MKHMLILLILASWTLRHRSCEYLDRPEPPCDCAWCSWQGDPAGGAPGWCTRAN